MDDGWRTVSNPTSGETFTFLETSEDTGGARVVTLIALRPGGAVAPHSHRLGEKFECVNGTFTAHLDGQDATLSPCQLMIAEPNVMHGFRNDTDWPATVRVTATPAGDFDKIMRTLAGLARDGRLIPGRPPKDPLVMASLAYRGRYYRPPLPRWLYWPLIGGMAALGGRAADRAMARYNQMPPSTAAPSP
jgi:quercetin dioxygenase-like cupin family protein